GTTPTWTTQLPTPTTQPTLPTYPFQHQRYWLRSSVTVAATAAPPVVPDSVETGDGSPRDRFSGLSGDDLLDEVLSLVRVHAAVALGHDSPEPIVADRAFQELGFESLTAVALRRRLVAETGLELPVSVVFDHPTPTLLAEHLAGLLAEDEAEPAGGDDSELTDATDDELFALIDADGADGAEEAR
ncbi:acyl carrier protein, partial [Streptomyces sp. NPDC088194]|uniref:acyl carrier protein n=1 Tax=Streptomyces sp. NPDC088194 TaxID=3154931 RepID=UPI00344FC45E